MVRTSAQVPTYGDLQDYHATLGFQITRNDWNTDVASQQVATSRLTP
jgi:hypothetical protein